jgi:hypothetical protein
MLGDVCDKDLFFPSTPSQESFVLSPSNQITKVVVNMKVSLLLCLTASATAFLAPLTPLSTRSGVRLNGYLDDLSKELYQEADEPDIENETREATKAKAGDVDRAGVGSWDKFVDFDGK